MRMPVALDHLRCHRRGLQAQPLADADFMLRLQMAECAHRAGKLADTHILCCGIEAHQVALDLRIPVQQLQSERGRLRVDAVRAADRRCVLELQRAPLQHLLQPEDALMQQPGGSLHLQRLRRIHHIVRGQAVVQPARLGCQSSRPPPS